MNRLLRYVASRPFTGEMTDYQLLHRFRAEQDESAFGELVRRHGPLVWGVCRRNLWNQADAEDAFQATFLVLLRRAERLTQAQPVGPWLYKVAIWCCRNIRRGNQRRLSRVGLGLNEDFAFSERDLDSHPALDAAVLSLPEKYRIPVVLCHLQGMSRQQVAEYLGCPEGTLSARLSRALAKLRVKLTNHDPAALLAIGGAMIAPAAVAKAAIRAATIYVTATGSVPPVVLSTSDGVVRMFGMRKLRLASAALVAIMGLALVATKLAAGSNSPDAPQTDKAKQPQSDQSSTGSTLSPGRWSLIQWNAPHAPDRLMELTIAMQDGKPTITSVRGDLFKWSCKEFTVSEGKVAFTLLRDGSVDYQFNGLIDPSNPNHVRGSLRLFSNLMDRAELELVPPGGTTKLAKASPPPLWEKYLDLAHEYHRSEILWDDSPQFQALSPEQQKELRAGAEAAATKYYAKVPQIFRQIAAEDPPSAFSYDSIMQLLDMLDRIKLNADDIATLATAARRFAAMHGPQYEAYSVGQIAVKLIRVENYAEQARSYAKEADKLAKAAGIEANASEEVAEFDAERAAWASQANPPKKGSTWTATVVGTVTDSEGKPIAGAEVLVNNMQWVSVQLRDGSNRTTTGPDGKYSITLKCQGTYRLHVTKMWSKKAGFVRSEHVERHKLLPGETQTVNFTLARGESFGGTLKVRLDPDERMARDQHLVEITGQGLREVLWIKNNEKFELTLPPGRYTVELQRSRRRNPVKWLNLETGRTDHVFEEPPFQFTPETIGAGFDEMWIAMDYSYSHFSTKPDVDWVKLKEQYRPKAIQTKSADELAAVLKEMLAHLNDGHVWIITPGGKQIGTHAVSWSYNGNRKIVLDQLADTTKCGDFAIVGKTKPDGFGYFLMTRQSAATPELVKRAVAAIEKLADAPGFIVDLRNANGGNELFAQDIARLFCEKKVVYAKSRYRNGREHDEFGEDQPRWLEPVKSGKAYSKPVVCLLGPGCVSSGEGFAQMMTALPRVTTVGMPTRGSSGNPSPIELGETGISVYYSRWVDLMHDGTPIEGKGVQPTIRVDVPAKDYQDADPTLTKALEVLRAKNSSGK